jgi:hypothetical protein
MIFTPIDEWVMTYPVWLRLLWALPPALGLAWHVLNRDMS